MADEEGASTIETEEKITAEEYAENARVLDRIDELARRAGYNRTSMAAKIGLKPNMVGAWWNRKKIGKAPFIKAMDAYKIAQLLDTSVEYILTGQNAALRERETNSDQQASLIEWVRSMDRDQVLIAMGALAITANQAGLPPIQAKGGAKKEKGSRSA